jgi:hypothetical protein
MRHILAAQAVLTDRQLSPFAETSRGTRDDGVDGRHEDADLDSPM